MNLFLQLGTRTNARIIYVANAGWQSESVEVLSLLHAISGCDLVSASNGIIKVKWLSTLEK